MLTVEVKIIANKFFIKSSIYPRFIKLTILAIIIEITN